jgi:hypothetical protein
MARKASGMSIPGLPLTPGLDLQVAQLLLRCLGGLEEDPLALAIDTQTPDIISVSGMPVDGPDSQCHPEYSPRFALITRKWQFSGNLDFRQIRGIVRRLSIGAGLEGRSQR